MLTIAYATRTNSYTYDAINELTNMVDAIAIGSSMTNSFSYTPVGLLQTETGPWASSTLTLSYTNRLRAGLSLQQPVGSAWAANYTYDTANPLSGMVAPEGAYTYRYLNGSIAGPSTRVASISEPGGLSETNTFDSVARLLTTVLKSAVGSVMDSTAYGYDKASERLTQTNTSGSHVNFGYDGISQLLSANASEAGGASRALEQLSYGYDTAHNLNYRTNNGLTQTFSVNGDNELTGASRSGTLTVSGATVASATNVTVNGTTAALYGDATFSAAGFSLTSGNNTFTAVARDGEGNVSSSSVTVNLPSTLSYQYDGNGNLLYDGNRAFAYDGENQLVQVTVTNSWMSQFVYDGKMRRRIRREYTWTSGAWVEGSEVHYLYDGNLVLQERDVNNAALTVYTRGLDLGGGFQAAGGIGGLLARTDQTTAPSTAAFYHADGNGNVTCLATAGQFVVARYQYDPFGNLLAQSGSLASNNLYRFSSKEEHVNSGLYYYGYRFYDPNLQRWVNRDPVGESGFRDLVEQRGKQRPSVLRRSSEQPAGPNLYPFVVNDPVGNVDLMGLTDFNCLQTQQQLAQAYSGATEDPVQSLINIKNNSQGGGNYDYAYNGQQSDTWCFNGRKINADQMANFMLGFQAQAYDQTYPVGNAAVNIGFGAGIYYHVTGDTKAQNDPWDNTGAPDIYAGTQAAKNFPASLSSPTSCCPPCSGSGATPASTAPMVGRRFSVGR